MKNISLDDISLSVQALAYAQAGLPIQPAKGHLFPLATAPHPFPGKKYPTRVAWSITVNCLEPLPPQPRRPDNYDPDSLAGREYDRAMDLWGQLVGRMNDGAIPRKYERQVISYIGKPNRYRSIEANKIVASDLIQVCLRWECEFDTKGILRYSANGFPDQRSQVLYAYHPYGIIPSIIQNFTHKLYKKRLGGRYVYNYKKRFQSDQIDEYYRWYEATFGIKLKRPRQKPMTERSTPDDDD